MTAYATLLQDRPRGQLWTYGVKITGLPGFYNDGVATWDESGWTTYEGCLATREFTFDRSMNPLEPLAVGGGISIALVDDGTGALFTTFAPKAGSETMATATVDYDDTTAEVLDSTAFTVNGYAYCGLETLKVTAKTTGQLTITHGHYNSLAQTHRMMSETVGPTISTSPRVFRGRYVEILKAPVNADNTADTDNKAVVWAGYLKRVTETETGVTLQVESLTEGLKDSWPSVLAAGYLNTSLSAYIDIPVSESDFYLSLGASSAVDYPTLTEEFHRYPLYQKDPVAGTFSAWTPFNGMTDLMTWLSAISATIEYATGASGENWGTPVTSQDLRFEMRRYNESNEYEVWATNDTAYYIHLGIDGEDALTRISLFPTPVNPLLDSVLAPDANRVFSPRIEGTRLQLPNESAYVLYVQEDSPYIEWSTGNAAQDAFAVISGGGEYEIVRVTGTSTAPSVDLPHGATRRLSVERGQYCRPVDWAAVGADETPRIHQILTLEDTAPRRALQHMLLGTGDYGNNPSTAWDQTPVRAAAVPARYVDYDGIFSSTPQPAGNRPDMPLFWVEGTGKGADDLVEWLKFMGLCLTTTRFTRGSEQLFGLTAVSVDTPTATLYDDTLTDAQRLANTRVLKDNNSMLIVNAIKYKSRWDPALGDGQGTEVTLYHDTSIETYGPQKTLEASPKLMLSTGLEDSAEGRNRAKRVDLEKAQQMAFRWWGAYSDGNYTLTVQAPHVAGAFGPGQLLKVTFANIRDIDGTVGIADKVFQVVRVTEREGLDPKAELTLRGGYSINVEKAPCAQVTAGTGTTLTLAANTYSDSGANQPYGGTDAQTDADWFDPDTAGGDIEIIAWQVGDRASAVTRTVSARSGNSLTIDSGLGWDPATYDTRITFRTWDNVSAWQQRYAYICDNAGFLGTGDDEAKRYT